MRKSCGVLTLLVISCGAWGQPQKSDAPDNTKRSAESRVRASPEMERLVNAFVGKWVVKEMFEVSASKQGRTREETASFRAGPGFSLIEEYRSNGSAGDTNACIALINGTPPSVRAKFQKATDMASIGAFDLWYGVAKSSRREFNRKRLEAFFAGPLHSLPFANEDAEIAGAIRADPEASGKPIGAYDLLLAGQAMRNKL